MKTHKIYEENVYLTETNASVKHHMVVSKTDNPADDSHHIVLDKTVFFPTGGGQSCDIGQIIVPSPTGGEPVSFDVIDVFDGEGLLFHKLRNNGNLDKITARDKVICRIDWQHRFKNMQRHCSEHLFSGAVYKLYHGINCGFHIGKDFMTADIKLDENSPHKAFTPEMAREVEDLVNSYIWQNLPVNTYFCPTKEEALAFPLRKELKVEKDIRVVMIGPDSASDWDSIADCVACCGTHPSTTGQIGLFKIYKIEKNKGMFRVYFDAGMKALADYQAKYDIVNTLAIKNSTSAELLLDVMDKREKEAEAEKDALILAKKHFLNQLASSINEEMSGIDATSSEKPQIAGYIHRSFDFLSANDILEIGKLLKFAPSIFVLIADLQTNTLFLFSDGGKDADCKAIVKMATENGAKGGGSTSSARIKFADANALDTFIKDLNKVLI